VQPLSASYVIDGIHDAEVRGAEAVLLRIDTPGGLDSSMRKVVGAVLRSKVKVVCWVGPDGARAASAGTFILLACDHATMAEGSNVGAAHPVGVQGQVLDHKVTNDAAAFIRSIAQARHRNARWAERAVRESVAISAIEAKRLGVIDAVVPTAAAALRAAGYEEPWTVHKESVPFGRGLLGSLVDPNLAFILFIVGIGGLLFEVLHPGLSVPGVVGLLAIVTSLVMFEMLPVNVGGLILLVAGVAFLLIEAHKPGFSLPGIAGIVSLVLGGIFLFDAGTLVRVSRPLLALVVAADALFMLVIVRASWATRRMPEPDRSLVGADGVATTNIDPVGTVRVRSEVWTAESADGPIPAGTKIQVVGEEGLRLRVDRQT
jgi:membrane-bound serine protease (ClpP class)